MNNQTALSRSRDRRLTERRAEAPETEYHERQRPRRTEERRDSPRWEVALDVREPHKKTRSCIGDLSVEGASYITTMPPMGDEVLLKFTVPTWEGPIVAKGRVVAREGAVQGAQICVTFTEIDLCAQLAIAEWFDLAGR